MIVVVDHLHTFELGGECELKCGRLDNHSEGIVGLDPLDLSISRRAIRISNSGAGWTLQNTSKAQVLHVERAATSQLMPLPPGGMIIIDRFTTSVEVRGSIRTHRLDFLHQESSTTNRPTTRSIPEGWDVETQTDHFELTSNERQALAALFSGYLKPFPRRHCFPLSYSEAAALLGISSTALRRRVERVRHRLARRGVYVDGQSAKHSLATYLIERNLLIPDDLDLVARSADSST